MTETDERLGFLQAICAEPGEDCHRLIFADWLDEHFCPERAEFIRVQVELAQRERKAALVRPAIYIDWSDRTADLRRRERELRTLHADTWAKPVWSACGYPETPMYGATGGRDAFGNPRYHHACSVYASAAGRKMSWEFSRGFISAVALSAADWLRHADAIAWRPGWEMACKARCFYSTRHRVRISAISPGKRCDVCRDGRVPRPFPGKGCQPIEVVALTTEPHERDFGTIRHIDRSLGTVTYYRWPGITFTLPG